MGSKFRYRHLPKAKRSTKDAYDVRDLVVFKMGYASYRDYLKSDLWKAIRTAVLAGTPKCEVCDGAKAEHVHHISYRKETMLAKHRRGLVALCRDCHHRIEFREDGSKRNFEATRKLTKRLLAKEGHWLEHTRHGKQEESDT